MRNTLFFVTSCILLLSCAAAAVHEKKTPPNKITRFTVDSNYDSTWSRIVYYFYQRGAIVTTINKTDGVFNAELENCPVTYTGKKGEVMDPTAIAITERRRRINNSNKIIPKEGKIGWNIIVEREGNTTKSVYITLKSMGIITAYYEEGFLKKKIIKNSRFWSTGVFEKQFEAQLK